MKESTKMMLSELGWLVLPPLVLMFIFLLAGCAYLNGDQFCSEENPQHCEPVEQIDPEEPEEPIIIYLPKPYDNPCLECHSEDHDSVPEQDDGGDWEYDGHGAPRACSACHKKGY